MEAEKYLREARMDIAATLKADEKEIYFTSGGTESDNWALIGTAMANKRAGKHIITTAIEHAAVIQPMIYLQEAGICGQLHTGRPLWKNRSSEVFRCDPGRYDPGVHHVCQ